jgi:hypothetical protein
MNSKNRFYFLKFIKRKNLQRYHDKFHIKNRRYKLTFYKKVQLLTKSSIQRAYFHKVIIHIKPNNVFCTFINTYKKKILESSNSATFSINITKKQLKHNIPKLLLFFIKKIFQRLKAQLIIKIISPKYLKKRILRQIRPFFSKYQKQLLIEMPSKKCFNGCKPPKNRRKKRKYNIIYKT